MSFVDRLPLSGLRRVAVVGAVLSGAGVYFMYNSVQTAVSQAGFYTKGVAAARAHAECTKRLGAPLRAGSVALFDKRNSVHDASARVVIPIDGERESGDLFVEAVRRPAPGGSYADAPWELTGLRLDVVFTGETLNLLPASSGSSSGSRRGS
eukprot:UC1_evm1s982